MELLAFRPFFFEKESLGIQRAFDRQPAALKYMGVDHSGADILMPEQLLHGANVIAILQ